VASEIGSGASVTSRLMPAGCFASKDLPGLKAGGAVEQSVCLAKHLRGKR